MPFSRLILERGADNSWRLCHPFTYRRGRIKITVPRGFRTDFASIPRLFWRLFPKNGRYDFAAVLHDWLYACGRVPRSIADEIFLNAMKDCAVPAWQRWPMYWSVRCFGSIAWNHHRSRRMDGEREHLSVYSKPASRRKLR